MKPIIRIWVAGTLIENGPTTVEEFEAWTQAHTSELVSKPHVFEIEFPDAPLHERFLRFGTDKSLMVDPIEWKL